MTRLYVNVNRVREAFSRRCQLCAVRNDASFHRMKQWRSAFLAVTAIGATDVMGAAPPASIPQCEAAWVYARMMVAELHGHRVVFDTHSFAGAQITVEPQGWYVPHVGSEAPAPPADLIGRWPARNALRACPSLPQRLASLHIRYGDAAVRWALRQRRDGSYRAVIFTISLPLVSQDGQHAVVETSMASAPLGGGGTLVHLVRDSTGNWHSAGWKGLWIS
jgi:hypothetical protein